MGTTVMDDLAAAAAEASRPSFDLKLVGGRYFIVTAPDGTEVSQHTDLSYALEAACKHASANGIDGKYYVERNALWEITTVGFGIESKNPGDVLAPTKPASVTATLTGPQAIRVNWGASYDTSGIREYVVSGVGTTLSQTVSGLLNEAIFSNLEGQTAYSFNVKAVDNTGLESEVATSNSVTTQAKPDITAPNAPTGLTATAISSSQIDLAWAAATDPAVAGQLTSGVVSYKVYRGGTLRASVTGTTYSDTGLTPATQYSYRVSALDGAGNESAQSAPASATTKPATTYTPATPEQMEAAGYIVVTRPPYNAVNDGKTDATVALQSAFDAGFRAFKPVYIPSGEYLVNDTLGLYHWNITGAKKQETRSYHIQGSTIDPPVIKLKANATGFGDPNDPRPIFNARAFDEDNDGATPAPQTEAKPTHPYGLPPPEAGYRDASGMVVSSRLHSVIVDTNSNPGAIGVTWSIAQGANGAHIKVIATGSFAGIAGTTGTAGFSNIEVIGGRYGLYYPKIRQSDFNSGTYVSSYKLTGQTVAAIALADFTPEVFVGGYISLPANVPVMKAVTSVTGTSLQPTGLSGTPHATPVMVDTVVVSAGSTVPLFQIPNRTVYLRNIRVTGTDLLISPYDGATPITAAGTWKTINEYSRAGSVPGLLGNVDGSWSYYDKEQVKLPHRAIIDGVLQKPSNMQHQESSISGTAPAPASVTMYVDQHAHPPLPCMDTGNYVNVVTDFNAPRLEFVYFGKAIYESSQASLPGGDYFGKTYPNNRPRDAQPAIQAAIDKAAGPGGSNRVFLPRGIYYVSRPIELRPHTQLFGVGSQKTVIACMWDWTPTSKAYVVMSADDSEGTASMSDLLIEVRKEIGTTSEVTALPGYTKALPDPSGANGGKTFLYSNDYLSHILWRTGRKSWTHGVETGTEYADDSWPTLDRQQWTFTGKGGGRHWYIWAQGLNNCHANSRVVLTKNTTQPLTLYGINVEMGKGVEHYYGWDPNSNIEFRDSENIRMYGSKREGNGATVWINNSRNVAMYGSGAHRILPISSKVNGVDVQGDGDQCYHLITGSSDNVLIAVATCQGNDYAITEVFKNRLMLKEKVTGQTTPVRVYYPEGVSLYKRGNLDDGVMVSGPQAPALLWKGDFSTGNFTQYPNDDAQLSKVSFFFVPPFGAPPEVNVPAGNSYGYRSGSWTISGATYSWPGGPGDGSNLNLVRTAAGAVSQYPLGNTRGTSPYAARFRVKAKPPGGTGAEPRDGDIPTYDVERRRSQLQCIKPLVRVYSPNIHLATRWYSVSIFNPLNQPSLAGSPGWGPMHFGLIKIVQRPGGCFGIGRDPESGSWRMTTDHSSATSFTDSSPLSEWWQTCQYTANTGLTRFPELEPDFPIPADSRAALANVNLGGWTDFVIRVKFDHRVNGVGSLDVWMRAAPPVPVEISPNQWVHVLAQKPRQIVRNNTYTLDRGIGFNFEGGNNAGGVGIDLGIYCSRENIWDLPRDFEVNIANVKVGNDTCSFSDMSPDGTTY